MAESVRRAPEGGWAHVPREDRAVQGRTSEGRRSGLMLFERRDDVGLDVATVSAAGLGFRRTAVFSRPQVVRSATRSGDRARHLRRPRARQLA